MENKIISGSESLEQRLRLLDELAGSIERAHTAVLGSDLAALKAQTVRQHELCIALRQVERPHAFAGKRWNRLLEECAQTEMRVLHLNREYGALLARALRTINIFCRVLANSEITYLPPRPEICRSGVRS